VTGARRAQGAARFARDADLLVVGHRGRGAVASALLGSVGLRCVLHSTCPVTVVPAVTAEHAAEESLGSPVAAPA
jgi:nucleotide-binding universal stress UspA family protein